MLNQIPTEIISNVISIILVIVLFYKFLGHKKQLAVIQKLDSLNEENSLTQDDILYIQQNEKEYKEKAEKAQNLIKFLNPIFILIVGIIFIYLPFSEALLNLNAFIVAYILIQLDKINKNNTYILLKELRKSIQNKEN
jgi:Na+/H+ antiporter NhaD/arsenite permease-like protein